MFWGVVTLLGSKEVKADFGAVVKFEKDPNRCGVTKAVYAEDGELIGRHVCIEGNNRAIQTLNRSHSPTQKQNKN